MGSVHLSLPPANALQASMLALLDDTAKEPNRRYFASPYAWAPVYDGWRWAVVTPLGMS